MKIVFVLECANLLTNGTTATCNRFAEELRKLGHEVTVIGCDYRDGKEHPNYVALPYYKFPVFNGLILREGFNFCKVDKKILYETIKGADIVHIFLPFKLGKVAQLIADELGVPVTTAFHLQPQNITSAIHLGHWKFANNVLYKSFYTYLYQSVKHVHCPSKMIATQLAEHHYEHNETHVVSNGVIPFFHRVEGVRPKEWGDKFVLVMVGRLASEKRQDLIIKAVAKSKHNDKIQVVLCGQGPNKKMYEKMAKRVGLANPLDIRFCKQEELRNILSCCDLYVHASDFEIEGIAAIEAITCGAVPLISDSKQSATSAFSLNDEVCVFHHGSVKDLQKKIDYLYENPGLREELRSAYLLSAPQYALSRQVSAFEAMLQSAIEDKKAGKDLPTLSPRKKDLKKRKKIFAELEKDGVLAK